MDNDTYEEIEEEVHGEEQSNIMDRSSGNNRSSQWRSGIGLTVVVSVGSLVHDS